MTHRNAGFTLIEILVVLAIIATVVSIATINTNHDGRYDDLKNESQRLKFVLSTASDEALFQNKNIGLLMSRTEIKPYSYEIKPNNNESLDPKRLNKTQYQWLEYTGKQVKPYTLPENMSFELAIDGQVINLPFALKDSKEEISPNIYLLASGEQSQLKLNIVINELDAYGQVRGDGLGRFFSEVIREE